MSNKLCDECEELKEELALLTIDYDELCEKYDALDESFVKSQNDYDELEGILNSIKDLIRYM